MTSTQAAIRQTRPFQSKGQEALVALFLTADRLRGALTRLLQPYGLTPQQYNVLRILRGAEPEGLPTLAIGDRMIERTPGITRMIDRLEAKGFVQRERRSEDRRCVDCRITTSGLELLKGLDKPIARFDREVFESLAGTELERFTNMLDRVRAAQEPG